LPKGETDRAGQCAEPLIAYGFRLRVSAFGLPSVSGLRVSDFRSSPFCATRASAPVRSGSG